MVKKEKKKIKVYKCDECGEPTNNKDQMCDKCLENGDGEAPQDWEFDAYGEQCFNEEG